jgi:acetylornithine/succinyldiaminopimelate/putrescine aminotransferase
MKLFDVYPINDITIEKAAGSNVWDDKGTQYLDLYGGHAVISIGHTHPHYVQRLTDQLNKVGFYSNSIKIPLQQQLAEKLGRSTGAGSSFPATCRFICDHRRYPGCRRYQRGQRILPPQDQKPLRYA